MLRSLSHARRTMTSSSFAGAQNGSTHAGHHSVTALSRWSSVAKSLPGTSELPDSFLYSTPSADPFLAVGKIKSIHIYDFDNTRKSPENGARTLSKYSHSRPPRSNQVRVCDLFQSSRPRCRTRRYGTAPASACSPTRTPSRTAGGGTTRGSLPQPARASRRRSRAPGRAGGTRRSWTSCGCP